MSLIGLLTATEKQVHLGRLHMRPIQWHLKNNWRVPESSDKQIPIPKSLHTHLKWWLEEDNVLQGQPLNPLRHALQIFTDASKEGWVTHLNEHTARGTWSLPESQLHINYLELKSVFYPTALKGCRGIVFTHGVRMGGWAGGRAGGWAAAGNSLSVSLLGCISETVRCRKLILGRDIG